MKFKSTWLFLSPIFIHLCGCGSFLSKNAKASNLQEHEIIPRELLFKNPERTNPQISPDGKKLAYCAPAGGVLNIWVKTLGEDNDTLITNEQTRNIEWYQWSPDSSKILYRKDTNGDENYRLYGINIDTKEIYDYMPFAGIKSKLLATGKHFPDRILVEINKDNPSLFDVYSLNLNSGELTLVAKNPGNVRTWLADRRFHIRAAVSTHEDGTQSLLVRDDDKGDWKTLLKFAFEDTIVDELYCGLLSFSHDGEHLYLNTSLESNTRRLIKIAIKTGRKQVIAYDDKFDISGVRFNEDTFEPESVSFIKERVERKVLNTQFQEIFDRMTKISDGMLDSLQQSYDGKKWVLGFMYDNKSYEYYYFDSESNKSRQLFQTQPLLNQYTLQWLTSRGYSCLQVNYRGSSGYGKEFLAAGNGEWGNKMHHDLIDAVEWAVKQGIADPKRIGIFGASYGGYAALVGATFTPDTFACAVDYVGPSNLITLLNSFPVYWPLGPWEKRIGPKSDTEFLKSRSPLFKIDEVKIPIFIAHGAKDVRVTVAESQQLVTALKTKGVHHEYLECPDEGHGFERPENKMTFYRAVEKFLALHLGGRFEE